MGVPVLGNDVVVFLVGEDALNQEANRARLPLGVVRFLHKVPGFSYLDDGVMAKYPTHLNYYDVRGFQMHVIGFAVILAGSHLFQQNVGRSELRLTPGYSFLLVAVNQHTSACLPRSR